MKNKEGDYGRSVALAAGPALATGWRGNSCRVARRRGAERRSRSEGKRNDRYLESYIALTLYNCVTWTVEFHPAFETEFDGLSRPVQTAIAARAQLIEEFGPQLGRPYVDTLEGSKHANMKELRCQAGDGVWRVAFAFDPDRKAVLLVGGDKSSASERRFYRRLFAKAGERFDEHLRRQQGRD